MTEGCGTSKRDRLKGCTCEIWPDDSVWYLGGEDDIQREIFTFIPDCGNEQQKRISANVWVKHHDPVKPLSGLES